MWRNIYHRLTGQRKISAAHVLQGKTMPLPIEFRKRPNARRYIMRLNETGDGGYVTIPRGGSMAEAQNFAKRNAPWLEERMLRWRESSKTVSDDSKVLFRGEAVPITISETEISFSGLTLPQRIGVSPREQIKFQLWNLARQELPVRVAELAQEHTLAVKKVSVRDQRSRWGSCSMRGVLSLNWRLIQTPDFVRDYIIVHELMHLREMNHSSRYWKLVSAAFPRTDEAERWLKQHANLLRTRS